MEIEIREYYLPQKAEEVGMMAERTENILKAVVAVLLPPAAAFWQVGLGVHFWINLALTIGAWVPGIVHALWLIFREKYSSLNIERP